jgi:anti-sigma28 factor (negative regulator of flagellin synthesis)
MDNRIDINKIAMALTDRKITQKAPEKQPAAQEESVSVTNHLDKWVTLLASEGLPEPNTRILDLKNRIEANEYKVDVNALSDKLIGSGLLTPLGE